MTRFGETVEEVFEPELPDPVPGRHAPAVNPEPEPETPEDAAEAAPEVIPIETAAGRAVLEAARRLAENPDTPARLKAIAAGAYGSFALRPLGPDITDPEDALLFRSRNLAAATNEEITHLVADLGVRSIYDVRSTSEVASAPQLFPLGTKTVALHPVSSVRAQQAERWLRAGKIRRYGAPGVRMQANYRRYVDDYPIIGAALRAIATEAVPALVHCTQGKDRTGVLSAVILYAAGASWDAILMDYLASNYVNADLNAADAVRLGEGMDDEEREILMSFFTARPSYLAAFFDEAERRYGSLERYLTEGLRLSQAQRVNLAVMARTDLFADVPDAAWRRSQRARTRLEDARFWDAKAATYDASAEADGFAGDVLRVLDVQPGERVLDMGCGTGQIALALAERGADVVAADFSEGMLGVLLGKLPAAGEAAERVTPLLLAWDDDWEAAGLAPDSVDVALSIRSFSTEHMTACLDKLTRTARRSATVVMQMGYSPRIMPELLNAVGIITKPARDADLIVEHLRKAGRSPRIRILAEQRRRTFADLTEAREWGLKMIAFTGVNVAAPENEGMCERLDAWLEAQFARGARDGAPAAELAITQTLRWAVITWECG